MLGRLTDRPGAAVLEAPEIAPSLLAVVRSSTTTTYVLRLDVLAVIDASGKRPLEDRDNTCFHLRRHEAGIDPDGAHARNVDAREDV
jgi:hypothetical protein